MSIVSFYSQINYRIPHQRKVKAWLSEVVKREGQSLEAISIIVCSDDELLKINQEYLDHHDYTDIITFDLSDEESLINGELYISKDRAKENSASNKVLLFDELCRLMVHGILHLLGYQDKTSAHKLEMTAKEDFYLSLRRF